MTLNCLLLSSKWISITARSNTTSFASLSLSANNKTRPHYVQSIVAPIWLRSQCISATCTLTKQNVHRSLFPLVVIQCVFYPSAPRGCLHSCCSSHCFSSAKPINIQSWEGSSGFLPKLHHCSSLSNNYSVLSVSSLPASVGPPLIPRV